MVQLDLRRHVWRSLEEMAREQTRDVRRQSAPAVPCVACTGTWVELGSKQHLLNTVSRIIDRILNINILGEEFHSV